MKVSDLVFRSGGLQTSAYTLEAELTRIDARPTEAKTIVMPIHLGKALENDREHDLFLQENDFLVVRSIPEYRLQELTTLEGEFTLPGSYVITKGERLSSLLERAKGFTDEAFLKGAVFTRESVRQDQERRLEELIATQERELINLEVQLAGREFQAARESERAAIEGRRRLLTLLRSQKPIGRLLITIDDIERFKESENDIALQAGDRLIIPKTPFSVSIVGGVLNPGTVVYKPGANVRYYLSKVGGLTENARLEKLFVVKADGTVVSRTAARPNLVQRGFFLSEGRRSVELEIVEQGDVIFAPERFVTEIRFLDVTKELVDILFKTAVSVGAIINIF